MTQPRGIGTKGVPRALRETMILDAATERFGRWGYTGTSLATLAERAGVSKPLVLSYFGSKEGLYIACVRRAGENLVHRVDAVLDGAGPSPLLVAQQTLAAVFEGLETRPNDWNVLHDRTTPADSAARDASRHYRNILAGQAARGVKDLVAVDVLTDPDDISVLIEVWISTVTALVNWWVRNPGTSAREMSRRTHRVIAGVVESSRVASEALLTPEVTDR